MFTDFEEFKSDISWFIKPADDVTVNEGDILTSIEFAEIFPTLNLLISKARVLDVDIYNDNYKLYSWTTKEAKSCGWLCKIEPARASTTATKEEINTVENRLNIDLPDDYKKFLLTSNGFECFSYTGVTLAPIDKVDFLIKVDEQLVDIWSNSMDDIDTTFGDKLKSSIIIGGHEEKQIHKKQSSKTLVAHQPHQFYAIGAFEHGLKHLSLIGYSAGVKL